MLANFIRRLNRFYDANQRTSFDKNHGLTLTINTMDLDKIREASPLIRAYVSMPNISFKTPETAEMQLQTPSATTALTCSKSKSLPDVHNVVVPITCVDLQATDVAIKDQVVTLNMVGPKSRSCSMTSRKTLNDMDLEVAKSRASSYAASRLDCKVYRSMPNIKFTTPETAIQVPSAKTRYSGVGEPDQTQCSDAGQLCETTGGRCCDNGSGGNPEHGKTRKSRSFWKRTKKFFRRLLCCA